MHINESNIEKINIPNGFIVFISGVPGVGKTTISYELLKRFNCFRIIEETDILRDALRGYNEFICKKNGSQIQVLLNDIEISDHTKLLSLEDAKQQCIIMQRALENIVARQQRKGISSIINGVHIVPEILKSLADNPNIIFINLYTNTPDTLHKRILQRDPKSYMLQHIPFIFQSNLDLYYSTQKLCDSNVHSFYNIDISSLDITETLSRIVEGIYIKIQDTVKKNL